MIREGRRSALGHPAELTSALKNRIVEMTASPINAAIKAVNENPLVESVTQLGNQIHILLVPDAPPVEEATVELVKQLQSAGFTHLRAKPAEPNLEDVFVCQSHGEELKEGIVCG
jgi:ABC-type multidrug transport system ATPase subunit